MGEVVDIPKVNNYRDLVVWQQGIQLVKLIYKITSTFPKEEMYGLTSQMRRCAVSIPSNIAEGHARDSLKEYIQFLSIAVGSLAELQTQLILSRELELGTKLSIVEAEELADKSLKMIRSLQRALKAKLPQPTTHNL